MVTCPCTFTIACLFSSSWPYNKCMLIVLVCILLHSAEKFSPTPKLIIGLPASPSAAGSGYQSPSDAAAAIKSAAAKNPGITWGFFVWSVAYDCNNAANGVPFSGQVAALLKNAA